VKDQQQMALELELKPLEKKCEKLEPEPEQLAQQPRQQQQSGETAESLPHSLVLFSSYFVFFLLPPHP
jgi:hypothetical protein